MERRKEGENYKGDLMRSVKEGCKNLSINRGECMEAGALRMVVVCGGKERERELQRGFKVC